MLTSTTGWTNPSRWTTRVQWPWKRHSHVVFLTLNCKLSLSPGKVKALFCNKHFYLRGIKTNLQWTKKLRTLRKHVCSAIRLLVNWKSRKKSCENDMAHEGWWNRREKWGLEGHRSMCVKFATIGELPLFSAATTSMSCWVFCRPRVLLLRCVAIWGDGKRRWTGDDHDHTSISCMSLFFDFREQKSHELKIG